MSRLPTSSIAVSTPSSAGARGWVADVFSPERPRRLPGHRAMGHVRYSTAGTSSLRNAQPITATTAHGPVAIAHNGNLVNADELRRQLEADGAVFQSSSEDRKSVV